MEDKIDGRGRPRKEININQVGKLAKTWAPLYEIAAFFEVSENTLRRIIKDETGLDPMEFIKRHRAAMNVGLRSKQIEIAMGGSEGMLKYLGKHLLGQDDKITVEGEIKHLPVLQNEEIKRIAQAVLDEDAVEVESQKIE